MIRGCGIKASGSGTRRGKACFDDSRVCFFLDPQVLKLTWSGRAKIRSLGQILGSMASPSTGASTLIDVIPFR